MPNIIDKVNINGTSYDIKDSVSPAASITSGDIENWDNKVDSYSEHNSKSANILNEAGVINIGASGSSYALGIHLDSQLLTIHDPYAEVEYINIYPYSDGSDEFVHIASVATPIFPKDAANKQYVDNSIAAIDIPTVPSNVSAFTNDAGYISAETDPTVPSWAKASQKPTYTASEVGAVAISTIGMPSGVAPLNASSKIDESYLPSYVDDVIEGYYYNNKFWKESTHTTEIAGEAGKIYVDLSTDKTYRFGGTAFVEISSGTTVSVVRNLTSGTKVGTITVNGTGTDLYAPTPPSKVSELSNDSGFITGISAADVSTALGYTPYNSTNPNGYVNAAGASAAAPVQSVNSKTGAVTLSAADVGALPSNTTIPTVTNTYSSSGTDAVSGTAVYSALQTLDSSISATANSAISAITITDGKITASSKIAIPTVPSNISAFSNDAGYVTSSEAASAAPVQSVNGQTGAVTISDTKVTQTPLSGQSEIHSVALGVNSAASESTDKIYVSRRLTYNDSVGRMFFHNSNRTTDGYLDYKTLCLADDNNHVTTLYGNPSINSGIFPTVYLPSYSGTIALTADIPPHYDSSASPNGYLRMSDLPIYDGTVQTGT